MHHIGIGVFVDGDSCRCMGTENHSNTAGHAAFGNGFPDLRGYVVKTFPLGSEGIFAKHGYGLVSCRLDDEVVFSRRDGIVAEKVPTCSSAIGGRIQETFP